MPPHSSAAATIDLLDWALPARRSRALALRTSRSSGSRPTEPAPLALPDPSSAIIVTSTSNVRRSISAA
jgi:hypothetical protein